MVSIDLETNLETIQVIFQITEQEMVEMILNKHVGHCDQGGHTWKYCWGMQVNVRKGIWFKEMEDRDNGPLGIFTSTVQEIQFLMMSLMSIRNFSEMTELN